MKAIVLTAFGGIENLQLQEVSVPSVAAGELLVRVVATSINPLDCQIRRGDYPSYVPLPAITGMTCQASSSVQVWESRAYFSPSWTAFQADRGRDFSVIVDGVSN